MSQVIHDGTNEVTLGSLKSEEPGYWLQINHRGIPQGGVQFFSRQGLMDLRTAISRELVEDQKRRHNPADRSEYMSALIRYVADEAHAEGMPDNQTDRFRNETDERFAQMGEMVKLLFRLWLHTPEQRLLQLLFNITRAEQQGDGFYFRDEDLLLSLNNRVRRADRAE